MEKKLSELVVRIQRGDTIAENEFAQFFIPKLQVFFQARRCQEWEDLTQETMIAAILAVRKPNLALKAQLQSYVFGIAKNILNTFYERSQKRKKRIKPLDDDLVEKFSEVIEEAGIERKERLKQIAHCFREMQHKHKYAIKLKYTKGCNGEQIKKKLKLETAQQAFAMINYGLRLLRNCLKKTDFFQ